MQKYSFILLCCLLFTACTISYKFNGASIDYSKTKTITINDFPNRASLVNPLLSQQFNEALKDIYTKQTRLKPISKDGDMEISGEITGYYLTPMAIQSDALAAETRLTVTIRVSYTNRKMPSKDFEKTLTAYQNFPSNKLFTEVQDELCKLIIEELTETIYNQTAADW